MDNHKLESSIYKKIDRLPSNFSIIDELYDLLETSRTRTPIDLFHIMSIPDNISLINEK